MADVVDGLSATGCLEGFFFVRYGAGGPHVRLRVYGRSSWIERQAREIVRERFERYFRRNPSAPWSTGPHGDAPALDRLEFPPYVPEPERYGGQRRIGIAEREFELSSQTALALMARSQTWRDDSALGFAAQLHTALVHAFGLDRAAAVAFFARESSGWSRAVLRGVAPARVPEARRGLREIFEEAFAQQRAELVGALAPLWRALDQGRAAELPLWLRRWHGDHRGIARALQSRQHDRPLRQGELPGIAASFIHMTNNRLGIGNRDESLLAYILQRSLSEAGPAGIGAIGPGNGSEPAGRDGHESGAS